MILEDVNVDFSRRPNTRATTTRVLGKDCSVGSCSHGDTDGLPVIRLVFKNKRGVWGDILRYPGGGWKVHKFIGLDEDVPTETLDKLSNDDFIAKLESLGLCFTIIQRDSEIDASFPN
jgi:hypothetical protein